MNDVVVRSLKTLVAVIAAQVAVYPTSSSNPKTSTAVAVGATLITFLWNSALVWFTNAKSAKLDKLAQAIDDIVDKRIAGQAAAAAVAQATAQADVPKATS